MDHEATISGVTHILDQVQSMLWDLSDRYRDGMDDIYANGSLEDKTRLFMVLAKFAVAVEGIGEEA